MRKHFLSVVALLCAWPCIGFAQSADADSVRLNLTQLLERVQSSNADVAAARRNVDVNKQGEKVANAAKLPNIDASVSVSYLGNVIITDRDFTNSFRAVTPHLGNSVALNVYQPVYAGGAITTGVDMARTQTAMSETELDMTRQGVSIQAVTCFLELFKAERLLNVYDENIATTTRLLNEMRSRFSEGVVLKNDITRFELRLSTLTYDRLTIANRIDVLNHNLCTLLGYGESTQIQADLTSELATLPSPASRREWFDTSLSQSPSLRMLDHQMELNSAQRRLLRADRLPHVGLVAGESLNGPITFEIPALDKNYNYWYVGVSVTYNVSSLFKTSKSMLKNQNEREYIDARRRATEDNLNRTIDDTYTQFTQAFTMLETEEKNVELATENYRLVENRYNNQLALLTDMLDASTAKLDAEVRLVNARVNIIYYYYQLKYNSGTL